MPEIHNTDQMQASVKDILAYLSRELPDAIQNMAAPRFVACDFEEKTLSVSKSMYYKNADEFYIKMPKHRMMI